MRIRTDTGEHVLTSIEQMESTSDLRTLNYIEAFLRTVVEGAPRLSMIFQCRRESRTPMGLTIHIMFRLHHRGRHLLVRRVRLLGLLHHHLRLPWFTLYCLEMMVCLRLDQRRIKMMRNYATV
jgi:hypothetical protein